MVSETKYVGGALKYNCTEIEYLGQPCHLYHIKSMDPAELNVQRALGLVKWEVYYNIGIVNRTTSTYTIKSVYAADALSALKKVTKGSQDHVKYYRVTEVLHGSHADLNL